MDSQVHLGYRPASLQELFKAFTVAGGSRMEITADFVLQLVVDGLGYHLV